MTLVPGSARTVQGCEHASRSGEQIRSSFPSLERNIVLRAGHRGDLCSHGVEYNLHTGD